MVAEKGRIPGLTVDQLLESEIGRDRNERQKARLTRDVHERAPIILSS